MDNLIENALVITTSQAAQQQPAHSEIFSTDHDEASAVSKNKNSKHTELQQKAQDEAIMSSGGSHLNNVVDELTDQCHNVNLNYRESADVEHIATQVLPKRKNCRKKELKKCRLQMPAAVPVTNHNLQQPPSSLPDNVVQQHINTVQDLFMHHIGPLYASTSSRYLENLTHHPQFQFMQSIQVQGEQHLASPTSQFIHQSDFPNFCNSSTLRSEPTTPRYFQNAMQHPLLCKSLSVDNHNSAKILPANIVQNSFGVEIEIPVNETSDRKSPKKKKKHKKKEQNEEEKKFDWYLSINDIEEGLKNNTLIEGVLRINPKQFQHSYVSSTDRSEQDVLIDGIKNRNRALEGDVVVVQLLSDSDSEDNSEINKQKKGKVVYIKEKVHTRTCIGSLKLMPDKNRQKALFIPRDHRVPRLNIPFTSWPDNFYQDAKSYENTLFLAKIFDWFDTRFAVGKLIRNIGQSGDMESEAKAILAQTDLDVTPYGPEFRDLYPRLDYVIPQEEIDKREDCRRLCIFSIDPSNCRDIDDAVSCKELANGNYEFGVHISDVAYFLKENTALDEKVAQKATTIYLVERAFHMLPDELCMLCSLFPGVDKLSFSVFWEITPDGNVLSHRFSKTIIHSCCQLSYEHAQSVLEGNDDAEALFPETYNGYSYKDIAKSIKILGIMANIFRNRRFANGALRIDQPKVSFHLNATNGLPDSYWIYESRESHQLIEEFMLLANMTVAEKIHDDHPKIAFLRCHPPPSGFMLKQLAKALKPMGIDLDVATAGDLHRSLLPYVGPDNTDKGKAMVLNMLCAKPMARAKYFCAGNCEEEDFSHYALNVPLYTHFTSPIRRYADIMVHRLLAASLKCRENPNWTVDQVRMIAAQCNKQKYNAKKAGELSTELYTLKYIELHSPLVTTAVVVEVKEKYIDVIIVAMGLNRRIFFSDFPGKIQCIKSEAGVKLSKMEVEWNATDTLPLTKQVIEVFSILQVEMHKGDDMVKVETKLVRPQ